MADATAPSITAEIIHALAKASDDFGFEMRVGRAIRGYVKRAAANGTYLQVRHGETYTDYRTGVERHFDYQCIVNYGWRLLQLAIECKNFFSDAPIVVCGHRRIVSESFHDMLFAGKGTLKSVRKTLINTNTTELCQVIPSAVYPVSTPDPAVTFVGKSVFRPKPPKDGRDANNPPLFGYIVSKDREDYDVWNQSIGSAANMVQHAMHFRQIGQLLSCQFAVTLPVMVVPDGRLWRMELDDNGEPVGLPQPVEDVTLFRDHRIPVTDGYNPAQSQTVRLSHLHFVTMTGLDRLLKLATTSTSTIFWESHFPSQAVQEVTARFVPH